MPWPFSRSSSPVTFAFETAETKHLGRIQRPMAVVLLWSDTYREWQSHKLLIDTGADYTLLPRYMAGLLGLDLSQAQRIKTLGVGGEETHIFIEKLRVKVGEMEREIVVGFSNNNKIPALMGRHAFFETFTVVFDKTRSITFSD
ncbi:MAG TPA: hypothetical protein VD999_01835 [Vitreimonas sp.]|nr:hypothetical protein [Vitreimonas sp.]